MDNWGQIEQTTTPLNPKSNQSQNPFNPFTTDSKSEATNEDSDTTDTVNAEDEKKKNTNPFIDSNPFLGLLNPFKELQPTVEKKNEPDTTDKTAQARVVKTEEIQTIRTTITHKVSIIPPVLANYI